MTDPKTIQMMHDAGISFIAHTQAPWGGETVSLEPKDVEAFVADPDSFAAASYNVSKEVYLDWVESGGTVRCSAMNSSGSRCKSKVAGSGNQLEMEKWLALQGGYCSKHPGAK